MAEPGAEPLAPPRPTLVVVGAAGELARLLSADVFAAFSWREVWLLDTNEAVLGVASPFAPEVVVRRAHVQPAGGGEPSDEWNRATRSFEGPPSGTPTVVGEDGAPVDLAGLDAAVCVAVPQSRLRPAVDWLLPTLARTSIVFDIASEKSSALATLDNVAGDLVIFGTHPLFGPQVGSVEGQTIVVCPSVREPGVHGWFAEAVHQAGGVIKEMTAERHDLVMAYVQTAAHQALLSFADVVVSSGLDLEDELWACRTPQFETLLALVSRVLTPSQVTTIASIQLSTSGARIAEEYSEALGRLRSAVRVGTLKGVESHMVDVREGFSGSLFNRMQQAGNLAIRAVQSPRALLSAERRNGSLVGVAPKGRPDRLRVGEVVDVTTTTVVVRNLLVGPKGGAALLGPYAPAAKRMGVSGTPSEVELSLGKVDLFLGADLDPVLDEWLGSVSQDVRLLGPESVSGTSMAKLALDDPRVRATELVSEEVRAGQREFVIRCAVRADSDLSRLVGDLQARIDDRYTWPVGVLAPGVATPATDGELPRIGYLGPAGTFSAAAAGSAAELLGGPVDELVPADGFPALLAALTAGDVELAVLPICNSASGLVEAAAEALVAAPGPAAVGMVDVQVRFDAYARATGDLVAGAVAVSQPQGLLQCSRFLASHRLQQAECGSTVEGLERVVAGEADLALAPPGNAATYGLRVVAPNVGDLPGAITRFLVLASANWAAARVSGAAEVSTARSLWVVEPGAPVEAASTDRRYDEVVEGPSGRRLFVSTDHDRFAAGPGVLPLGTIPWSPRTPLVDL